MKEIVVAGGCFWGVEEYFRRLKGTLQTKVGYAQGHLDHPNYQAVCTDETGHAEVVWIQYEAPLTLEKILDHLFRIINPTSINRQGNDIGSQYRTGVYFKQPEDETVIQAYIAKRQVDYTKPIVVEVQALQAFWDAETYHQTYLVKNPNGYCHVDFSKIKPEERKD
ncbi:MAG: peptide-methionine (S)-S-oxide reductase MsrA [Erysipelotrichaceae bacterium]